MASVPGTLFDEHSTLSMAEKTAAVAAIGAGTSFTYLHGPGLHLSGSNVNDVFLVNDGAASIHDSGGVDVVISSANYQLGAGLEHLILTGAANLVGLGNSLDNVIAGNNGNNLLDGGAGNDLLLGGAGNDQLYARSGNDTLDGGTGNDTLVGGTGNQTLSGADGNDSIQAGDGHDLISGGAGDDAIFGNAGNDTIAGGNGNDTIMGGAGIDVFLFNQGDVGTTTILDFTAGVDFIGVHTGTNLDAILSSLTHDADGNAVLTIEGKTVTLVHVHEDDVTAGFFHIV